MSGPSRKRVVDCFSVGEPRRKPIGTVETLRFIIYDFEKRKVKKAGDFFSSVLLAHGYRWRIDCYPRGVIEDSSLLVILSHFDNDPVIASLTFRCKKTELHLSLHRFGTYSTRVHAKMFEEDKINEHLEDDGSLIIDIGIQMTAPTSLVWYPKKLERQDVLVDLYQDASSETSDVAFSVGNSVLKAHKSILNFRCHHLYEIAKDCDGDAPIPIHSTRGEILKSILDFVYTVKEPEIENKDLAKELLVAADCYNCVQLKLYIESVIVDKFLTPQNAAELLLLGDSNSCALLKEASMNLFHSDPETVKKSKAWSEVYESNSLLVELLDSYAALTPTKGKRKHENEIDTFDVATIRKLLEEDNLALDGSRDILVKRLKETKRETEKYKRYNTTVN